MANSARLSVLMHWQLLVAPGCSTEVLTMFDEIDDLISYNDSVTLYRVTGKDDWQKPIYSEPVVIGHARIDRGTVYSGTNNDRQIVAKAVIYIRRAGNSDMPLLDDSWLQGNAEFDGKTYVITTVNVLKGTVGTDVWGYELEVL
jgi:hypothetical protein